MRQFENHKLWRGVLITMLIPLAFVAFWPSPVDQPVQGDLSRILNFLHARGIPLWLNYQFVEASANVLLFVPLGAVASLAFTEKQWWQIGALGLLLSGIMELGQLLFFHNRFASPLDILTNTGGSIVGALLALVALKGLQASRLSAAARRDITED